ncbi:uncharacterized protein LOC143590206 [Bidens hawaiensis]|uniref:uncharacterized protein LOC143590206 n=1 Tax=Bidens hawaiensis TaxID=980011 RepID=UPI004049FDDE
MEIYVDDLVIKVTDEDKMLEDINETFRTFRGANMKLNPGKCLFGVEEGKFPGVVVTNEGMKANPEKVEALLHMKPPTSIKEVQRLNGRLVTLNRFLSRIAERTLPFMAVLRRSMKKNKFCWDNEADKAFEELKSHLCELPTMVAPKPGETLILYLSQTDRTISLVLMVERGEAQIPIYFKAETVFLSPCDPRPDWPLQQVLMKPEVSGRLAKWAIELGDHAIEYKPRTSFKGQILADFITESVPEDGVILVEQEGAGNRLDKRTKQDPKEPLWLLYTDGASNGDGNGAGLILISPEGIELTYVIRLEFPSTNNEDEYEALLAGFRMAQKMKVRRIKAHVDSLLVENQIKGDYEAKDPKMVEYLKKVKELMQSFEKAEVLHISRGMNKKTDALSKLTSVAFDHLAKEVKVETLGEPSIMEIAMTNVEVQEENWMTPILLYLWEGVVPEIKQEARRLRIKALQYEIIEGRCTEDPIWELP